MTDPTGTAALRRSFFAEGNRRLAQLRSQTHAILVEHDMMAARNDPLAQFLPNPGHRLSAFTEWFERTARYWLLGQNWWERFLQRAMESGAVAGSKLLGGPPHSLLLVPAVSRELYLRELAGIVAAMVQQVTRQVAAAAIIEQKPTQMYRAVLNVIRKVGHTRLKAFVNSSTVQLHNLARLSIFRENGITQVGIDAEMLEPHRPSRFGHQHDHLVHDDTRVERELRRAEAAFRRLQEEQRREAELEARQAERELERQRELLRREIEQRLAGEQEVAERTRAQAQRELERAQEQARREVERARERTAEREEEAREAWQRVQAARTEARSAEEYRPSETVRERRAREAAQAALAELPVGPERVFGLPTPERLRRIGELGAFVNVLTAGDNKVCQQCQDLADDGPYSLFDAQSLLPAHPNCRCAFIPAPQRDDEED